VSTKAELERPRSRSDQGFLHEFAADSPLEKAVSSEPVSERGSSAAGNYGTIPRRLWMITEAERAISGSNTPEFGFLPFGSFPRYLVLNC
jgi:hypothetical protein